MFTAQMNKSKKTKTKHRPPSPISIEEPVISSQEYCNETTRGEIPDEKPDIGEMKEYIPDIPMPDSIFKPGNQVSPTVVGFIIYNKFVDRLTHLFPDFACVT